MSKPSDTDKNLLHLAKMSHELRTPLNGILGHAQILSKADDLSAEHRASVRVIRQSGEHLLMLINDILDLAKIEAGRLELNASEFYFPEFLTAISEMIRIRAEAKGLAFVYETKGALPTIVRGDESRLRQVLVNLLGNAVKFTDHGKVCFRVGYLQRRVRFEVEDSGIGIAAEQLAVIFEPFQQAAGQDRHIEGTGLGLAISKQLSDAMGGQLRVVSELGKGSRFSLDLELPSIADQHQTRQRDNRAIVGYRGERRKILIVDDVEINRTVLAVMLKPLGFEIAEAGAGDKAVQMCLQLQPDAVLMDLIMPQVDGLQATRQLRAIEQLAELKIIAVSASAFANNRDDAKQAGCDDFIPKPVSVQLLLEVLEKHLALQWNYETRDETLGMMVVPPKVVVEPLARLAKIGDMKALLAQLTAFEQEHPNLLPFLGELQRLAREFQLAKIKQFLRRAGGDV